MGAILLKSPFVAPIANGYPSIIIPDVRFWKLCAPNENHRFLIIIIPMAMTSGVKSHISSTQISVGHRCPSNMQFIYPLEIKHGNDKLTIIDDFMPPFSSGICRLWS
jgi:hypothetical protein